jgi:mannose-6-phosphate isomerase class I
MENSKRRPVLLAPYFEKRIWGGRRLQTDFGFRIPEGNIGECWSVSGYPGRESRILNGPAVGKTLSELWQEDPGFFGNLPEDCRAAGYPFITKIIDAKDDLSIQVHPDDAYAETHENGARGKTECWYILDCPEDAFLILGHNARSREEFRAMIEQHRWEELLRRVPVKKGDFIQLEPGTIHAITAGVMLLETQQSSDITYRVYDYDRLENGKPRRLHIRQSIDVATVPAPDGSGMVRHTDGAAENEFHELVRCRYYRVGLLCVNGRAVTAEREPFTVCTVTDGRGVLVLDDMEYRLRKGDSMILPCDCGSAAWQGRMKLVLSAPVLQQPKPVG